jgi:hypothetical protein
MVFVPTPIQREPESPRVRELSQQLESVIAEFRRRYAMNDSEIRQALLHAAGRSGGSGRRRPMVALVAAAGAGAVALGGLVSSATTKGDARAMPVIALVIVMLVVVVGIAAFRNR